MASPYYQFAYQKRRYAYAPHGGPGGMIPGIRAAETTGLGTLSGPTIGDFDIEESIGPGVPYPPLSDWPLLRPAGLEPLDQARRSRSRPSSVGSFDSIPGGSMTMLAVAAAAGWVLLRKKR